MKPKPMHAGLVDLCNPVLNALPCAAVSESSFLLARELGVEPLAALLALQRCAQQLRPGLLSQFQTIVRENAQRNVRLLADVRRCLAILNQGGITTVVFKGPELSQHVFGNIAARRIGDIDIIVPSSQMEIAGTLLAKAGLTYYHSPFDPDPEEGGRASYLGTGWAVGQIQVEIHSASAFARYWKGTENLLWQEAQVLPSGARHLSPEFTVLHLAIHWHQHKFDFRTLVDWCWATVTLLPMIDETHLQALAVETGLSHLLELAKRTVLRVWRIPVLPAMKISPQARALSIMLGDADLLSPQRERDLDRIYLVQLLAVPKHTDWLRAWLFPPVDKLRTELAVSSSVPPWRVQMLRTRRILTRLVSSPLH
ncbi:MAG: nucleotidyltransferase family protein [Chloroflexi bacterium]|nr:nucleotidyltransferase family protein [Chloroflexota bacterium]